MVAADVLAAGVVTFRKGKQVLLVHRPKYDDWSFPKGKLDRGEHRVAAAVREVAEETGLHVRLGSALPSQRYSTGSRMKTVYYWVGWPVGDSEVSSYVANEEIERVEWLPYDQARERLTYEYDRLTLEQARRIRRRTQTLVIMRHGKARSRRVWRGDDRLRPLLKPGHDEAQRLVPLLAAYAVTRVVSSPSTRCVQTVAPYADTTGWELETVVKLGEEAHTSKAVHRVVTDLIGELSDDRSDHPSQKRGEDHLSAVLCTHRPVLPEVFDALGLERQKLEPGEMFVVHLRRGAVVGTERHP